MSRKAKLIARFQNLPTDFHHNEMVILLKYFGYSEVRKGKTSGSRVKFINPDGIHIILHRPHPGGILKYYQLKQIMEALNL